MIEENNTSDGEVEGFSSTRRVLIKAAWTVPAIMAIGTVPSYARSGSVCAQSSSSSEEGRSQGTGSSSMSGCGIGSMESRYGGFGQVSQGGYSISTDKVSGL